MRKALLGADWVIPLAAVVGAPACSADQVAARTVNVDAIRLLLSLRSARQRVLYPTTNSGYGVGEKGKFCTEETPLRPISLYGVDQSGGGEGGSRRRQRHHLPPGDRVRHGPALRLDLLVNDFVYRAVHDRTVVVFEGHAKRNYIHVRDVARAFLHGMARFEAMRDQPYNVGLSDANLSKLELCAEIRRLLPSFVYLEAPVGEDPDKRDYIVSNEKLERTGFRPGFSLEQGIRELIKGYAMLRKDRYSNV